MKAQVIVGLSFGLIVLFITILVCAKASSKRIAKAEAQQRDIHMTEPVPRPPDFPWSPSFENVSDLPPPTYQEAIDNTGEARRLGTAPGNCAATLQSDGSRAAVAEESPAANR